MAFNRLINSSFIYSTNLFTFIFFIIYGNQKKSNGNENKIYGKPLTYDNRRVII
nr:MAG TPA: hypothetical protein [Caudoviricetes sp.]